MTDETRLDEQPDGDWVTAPSLPPMKADREAMAALYRKKTEVTALLEGGIPKDGNHPKFKYTDASDAKKVIGGAMAHVGLSLHMTAAEQKRMPLPAYNGKDADLMNIWFYMTLCDAETGATETTMWLGEATLYGHDDRGFTKAATSAQKSFLMDTFLIGDKDEDKSPSARPQQPARSQTERAQPPAQNGAAKPAGLAAQDPAPAAPESKPKDVMLSSKDEDKWPKFLAWAKDKFNYDEPLVDAALAFYMNKEGYYNQSRDLAMGAVLAMVCGYDADIIRDTGERKKLLDTVINEALLVRNPNPVR